jgi:anti-sigma28 factor (negative regulator of flagellin synthesis)
MKVSDAQKLVPEIPSGDSKPGSASAAAHDTVPVDIVTTHGVSDLGASIASGMTMATTERAARLHALAQAVRSGTYHPSAAQLATKILEQAELDARLAHAFG